MERIKRLYIRREKNRDIKYFFNYAKIGLTLLFGVLSVQADGNERANLLRRDKAGIAAYAVAAGEDG